MNPLTKDQMNKLQAIGFDDLMRKVNEIVNHLNKKPIDNLKRPEDTFNETAEAIFDADTLYDAKEILFDYVKGLKSGD